MTSTVNPDVVVERLSRIRDMLANALTQLLTDYDQYTHEVARWLRDQEAAAD